MSTTCRIVLIICLCSALTLSGKAQEPDYKAIADSVAMPSSKFYYPHLMVRYRAMDTTLTAQDYRYLYYGYVENENYKPLLANSYSDSLNIVFGTRATPSFATYNRAVFLCKAMLQQEPFNIRDINLLAFSYAQIGDTITAKKAARQVNMLIETIMSTGIGLTEQSPWYITYFNHAEDVLNFISAEFRSPIIMSRTVEFFPVNNMPDKKNKGYYFDFEPIYARRPDYLDGVDKPKRKLEVNSLFDPRKNKNNNRFKFK